MNKEYIKAVKNYIDEINSIKEKDSSNEHSYRTPLENMLKFFAVNLCQNKSMKIVQESSIDDEDDSIPENRTLGSKTKEYDDIIESIVGLGYERRLAREKVMKYVKEHEKELSPLTHQEKEDRILMAVMRGY